jgi:hypothetical protein
MFGADEPKGLSVKTGILILGGLIVFGAVIMGVSAAEGPYRPSRDSRRWRVAPGRRRLR